MRLGIQGAICAALVAALPTAAASGAPRIERFGPASKAAPTVVTIHGGSWVVSDRRQMRTMDPVIRRLRREGFTVYNVGYGPGGKASYTDVSRAIRRIERSRGLERLCLYGSSAGGQLALMLAAKTGAVDCVVAVAAPLDLARLTPSLAVWAVAMFGPAPEIAARWSPLNRAGEIGAQVLLEAGRDDTLVPIEQHLDFVARRPATELVILEPGRFRWMHGTASRRDLDRVRRIELRFLREETRSPSGAGPS